MYRIKKRNVTKRTPKILKTYLYNKESYHGDESLFHADCITEENVMHLVII